MEEKLSRFLKHYLRWRATHPLVALLLLICLSGTAAGAANCTETCALNAMTSDHQGSVSLEDSCCGGSGRMACCEPPNSDSDKATGSELKLNFRSFATVLPTVASAPDFTTISAARAETSGYDQHAMSATQTQRLYLINRSLLI